MDDHDYGRLLVLQHSPEVHLGGIEKMLTERAVRRPFDVVDATRNLPSEVGPDVRGVLVLGGFQGVPEADQYPWMGDEMDLLASLHGSDVPLLGICLGAQMLGSALGGQVSRRDVPQIGLFGLSPTQAAAQDKVFAGFPAGGRVALTHSDQVEVLPPGAEQMLAPAGAPAAAGTPAWRLGETTHAVQFHPEIDPDIARSWLATPGPDGHTLTDSCNLAGVSGEELLAQVEAEARFLRAAGLALVGRWLDAVVGAGDPSPRKHRKPA